MCSNNRNKSPEIINRNKHAVVELHKIDQQEIERLRQQRYGREKLALTTTKSERRTMIKNKALPIKKAQKEGHEACLAKVVSERRSVEIIFADDTTFTGEVLEFDKFSIRVKGENGRGIWFFKSSMKGFKEL